MACLMQLQQITFVTQTTMHAVCTTYIQQIYVHAGDIQKALDYNAEFDYSAIMPKRSWSTNKVVELKAQEDKDY